MVTKRAAKSLILTDCSSFLISSLQDRGLDPFSYPVWLEQLSRYFGPWKFSYKGFTSDVIWVPGHHYEFQEHGPRYETEIMVVGMYPGQEEEREGRNLCGPSGRLFFQMIDEIIGKKKAYRHWYITNAIKYRLPPYIANPSVELAKEGIPVLQYELQKIRPRYVICLGRLPLHIFCGAGTTLRDMYGSSVEMEIFGNKVQIFALPNPASLIYSPETERSFRPCLQSILGTIRKTKAKAGHSGLEYEIITDPDRLRNVIEKILSRSGIQAVAVDCEWEGNWPNMTDRSWLISVQFYHPAVGAKIIRLRHLDGRPYLNDQNYSDSWWVPLLRDFFLHERVQLVGHFFQADMVWLYHYGIDLRDKYGVPEDMDAIMTGYYNGGFDLALAQRVLDEIVSLDLADMAVRELHVSRWDNEIEEYISQSQEGQLRFSRVPDAVFDSYAAYDVIYTYQIAEIFREKMKRERFGFNVYYPFYFMQGALPAIAEMMIFGMCADRQEMDRLRKAYKRKAAEFLAEMREELNWPDFNPRSADHCTALLFGEDYVHKSKKVLPDHVQSLNLEIIKETATSSQDRKKPATDQNVLLLLLDKHPIVAKIYSYRKLLKVVEMIDNLESYVGKDGVVRSFLAQTNKTGRMNSSSPNLQNLPKRQEHKYAEIMGDAYPGPLRGAFHARPGHVLIAADFAGAELLVAAATSRDRKMIDDCYASYLPDDDPRKKDIHSEICVEAFQLSCAPKKSALAEAGLKHLRDATKTIVFGDGYGGGVAMTTLRLNAEMAFGGKKITEEQVQKVLTTLRHRYPIRYAWNDELASRVENPGFIRNAFGFIRRFDKTHDPVVLAEMKREAMNFVPQSIVAFCIYLACIALLRHPLRKKLGYRFVLQIHDELVLECPEEVKDEVIQIVKDCMSTATFPAANCDGVPLSDEQYAFSVEVSTYKRWSC